MQKFSAGNQVKHAKYGVGEVQLVREQTALVRFESGFEERPLNEFTLIRDPLTALKEQQYDNLRDVLSKSQALTIRSINDSWGVFSTSRISLLPHQLWVCNQVLRHWPVQKLIADDVGLGKTIEAGLVLWPLIAKKRVKRLLVLTPASLVEQWQERLRIMFDIRLSAYSTALDTERSDYWNSHNFVIASLPTLRKDVNGRHERMLNAEDWDLLIVDEAHHLNALEDTGATLGYRFLHKLISEGKFKSRLFFSATPHRGKSYGFHALLHLLRPDLFDPSKNNKNSPQDIKQVVIRNNKQNVTDMDGKRLFKPVIVESKIYYFSPEEQEFYDQLTQFILTGQAYATSLNIRESQAVQLVLTAMQKLAASSVSAIHTAINNRIKKLGENKHLLQELSNKLSDINENTDFPELDDAYVQLEEEYVSLSTKIVLMENEQPLLERLQLLAEKVKVETKVEALLEILENQFKDRTVVFFTEYKATQALVVNTLNKHFGYGCATFINGENQLKGIINEQGEEITLSIDRYSAAQNFNEGKVRFIICTEAGGEGIDLQNNCYSMVHIDLPWNPMRLHQRVGRLNRYGQKHQVEVISLRNPETVESKLWQKLNEKIELIMKSLGTAMDEPEDLLQLILGMNKPGFFTELFSQAVHKSEESLTNWFDAKAGTFGGEAAIETVKTLVGNATRFEYKNVKDVPNLDLPDLYQFFEGALKRHGKRLDSKEERLSFITPDLWRDEFGIKRRYEDVTFNREVKDKEATILGVGHKIFSRAIQEAETIDSVIAVSQNLKSPLFIFTIKDQITGEDGNQKFTTIGFTENRVIEDKDLLCLLNKLYDKIPRNLSDVYWDSDFSYKDSFYDNAEKTVLSNLSKLKLPYSKPVLTLSSIFIPHTESAEPSVLTD